MSKITKCRKNCIPNAQQFRYELRQYWAMWLYIAQHDITTGNRGCRKIARPHVAEQGQDIPISFTLNLFLIVEHSETFHCGQIL